MPSLLFLLLPLSPTSASTFTVTTHPWNTTLPPGDPIPNSPGGSRPGSTCNRIHIRGLSRTRNLNKFFSSVKLKINVNVSHTNPLFRTTQTLDLCFHRNASIEVGMCPSTQWQTVPKGYWGQYVSPFENRILDIRMLPDTSRSIEVYTEEEFLFHRVVFLVLGVLMMLTARALSESVVFYYGSAMTIGVILVILMILFQGMRLLPTGRKSSLAIFLYSLIVGVGTFLLRQLSGLLRSFLLELGVSEDMHNPVFGYISPGIPRSGWSLVWLLGCPNASFDR